MDIGYAIVNEFLARVVYFFIIMLWGIFGIYWLMSWLRVRARVKTEKTAAVLQVRFVQLTGSVFAFTLIFWRKNFLAYIVLPYNFFVVFIGLIILALSMVFTIWARAVLGRNWSATIQSVQQQQLIQHGPYRWIRHPMYSGVIGGFVGTMLAQGTLASVVALIFITFCYVLKINAEEKFLLNVFGERYAEYQKKTWKLLPFVY